jgi:transcriptional regulator with XRE-family HTH domain
MLRSAETPVGEQLKTWRRRRHLSQLDLALSAHVSTRHLSFLETGRAQPSREMLLALAHQLEIPPREQNTLLLAAGFAPQFAETRLTDQRFDDARRVIEAILRSHEPYPALAMDRHWNIVLHNRAVEPVLSTVEPHLLQAPINVLRLSLHPGGIAPRIVNFGEWRAHLLQRLKRQIDATGDPALIALLAEAEAYPNSAPSGAPPSEGLAIPLVLQTPAGVLRYYTTTLVFGSPHDITLSELAIETFVPADAATAAALQA